MQVKCHRTIFCSYVDQKVKAFSSKRKNASPCIYLYCGCYSFFKCPYRAVCTRTTSPLWRTSPHGAALHCTEHVVLVSEHSASCLGNGTLRKHQHGNAIKSFCLWIVQVCFFRGTVAGNVAREKCRAGRGDWGRRGETAVQMGSSQSKPLIFRSSVQHSVLI